MGIRNKKSDEQRMRDQAAIKDSIDTGDIEAQAVAQKRKEKKETENKLFDVESARQRIREGLLGYREQIVNFKDPDTGDISARKIKDSTRKKKLCNEEGASVFMDEVNSFLNHNTISSYLPAKTIQNKSKGTLKAIYKQMIFNHHKYNIQSTEDAGDIISIIRNPMIDAMNKSRGGRMIQNQEKIRVEKESISREGGSDDEDSSSTLGGLF